jgi:hypothetical protein
MDGRSPGEASYMTVLERTGTPRYSQTAPMPAPPSLDPRTRLLAVWGLGALGAILATVFGIVFVRHLDVPGVEVGAAMYLAALGIAVVPITMLLIDRWRAEGHGLVLPTVVLLSAAAATIHFAAIDMQGAGYWLFIAAFALLAVFQLVWALLALIRPSRLLYVVGALGNLATVFIWAYSRAVDVPIGPDAGKPEPVAYGDVVSTVFEGLLVIGVLALLVRRARASSNPRLAVTVALLVSAVLIPLTGLAMISSVGTHLLVPPAS